VTGDMLHVMNPDPYQPQLAVCGQNSSRKDFDECPPTP